MGRSLRKSIKDAKGSITNKKYDELGRLIEQTNQLNQKENWEYDNVGNLLKNSATGSKSTSYDYQLALQV